MAARRRRKKKRPAQPKTTPTVRLRHAVDLMQRDSLHEALDTVEKVVQRDLDATTQQQAQRILAEIHFRLAAQSTDIARRIQHLEAATYHAPDDARSYFHLAVAFITAARCEDALTALDFVADLDPTRTHLAYLRGLAQLGAGQQPEMEGVSADAADALTFVAALCNEKAKSAPQLPADNILLSDQQGGWQALLALRTDEAAAPADQLEDAAANGTDAMRAVWQYYHGVAAMRQDAFDTARAAWRTAAERLDRPWLSDNLAGALRAKLREYALQGQWRDVLDAYEDSQLAAREATAGNGAAPSDVLDDKALAEVIGLAHFHLGYAAAQDRQWADASVHWNAASQYMGSRHLAQDLALAEERLGRWQEAAQAWRTMVRRRPRKETHPDYLSDEQVAAIWRHAADCYEQIDETDEVITCLKNAIKYAETDSELRMQLVRALMEDERYEAAENELDRILEQDPDHVPALMQLGAIYEERWDRDSMSVWRRVVQLDPQNRDARNALADAYISEANYGGGGGGWFFRLRNQPQKAVIQKLQEGLEELPGHPKLLLELGKAYVQFNKQKQARATLREAWETAPTELPIVAEAMHELLHVKGGDIVDELLPTVRQMRGLLSGFWISQGMQVLECELDESWAERFWDEAVQTAELKRGDDTKAFALIQVFELAASHEMEEMAQKYAERLRNEVPESGAVEYIEAWHAMHEEDDPNKAKRLLRRAQRTAQKAGETGVQERINYVMDLISGRRNPLFDLFNRGVPGMEKALDDRFPEDYDMDDILDNLDKEDLDELRKFFGI